jgi:hypothetical protein
MRSFITCRWEMERDHSILKGFNTDFPVFKIITSSVVLYTDYSFKIWGYHSDEDSSHGVLGCDTMYWYGRTATFQRQHSQSATSRGVITQKISTCSLSLVLLHFFSLLLIVTSVVDFLTGMFRHVLRDSNISYYSSLWVSCVFYNGKSTTEITYCLKKHSRLMNQEGCYRRSLWIF